MSNFKFCWGPMPSSYVTSLLKMPGNMWFQGSNSSSYIKPVLHCRTLFFSAPNEPFLNLIIFIFEVNKSFFREMFHLKDYKLIH